MTGEREGQDYDFKFIQPYDVQNCSSVCSFCLHTFQIQVHPDLPPLAITQSVAARTQARLEAIFLNSAVPGVTLVRHRPPGIFKN